MKFQIDGVKSGTNQPVRVVLEGPTVQAVMAKAAQMGIGRAQARPIAGSAPPPPPPPRGQAAPYRAAAVPPPPPAYPPQTHPQPPAYPPEQPYPQQSAYEQNPYAGQTASPYGGFPAAPRKSGKRALWMAVGIPVGVSLLVTAALLVFFLWPSGAARGMASGTSLDPRNYLPEFGPKDGLVTVSINASAITKSDLFNKLDAQFRFSEMIKKIDKSGGKIDDLREMLVIATLEGREKVFGVVKLNRAINPSTDFKDAQKVDPVEGYPVYRERGPRASYTAIVASDTAVVCSADEATFKAYMKRIKAGTRAEYPSDMAAALGQLSGGEIVIAARIPDTVDKDAPTHGAASISVGSGISATGVVYFRDAAAAANLVAGFEAGPKAMALTFAPNLTVTQSGNTVRMSASLTTAEIMAKINGAKGIIDKFTGQ